MYLCFPYEKSGNNFMRLLLLLISIVSLSPIYSQSKAVFRGNIYEKSNAQPIAFASVSLLNTKYYAESDLNGFFAIGDITPGTYTAVISYIGYEDIEVEFTLKAGEIMYNRYYMIVKDVELEAVEISGKREQARSEVQISKVSVTPKEIKTLPSASGDPDIAQFLTILPGVISSGDQGGQLFIRGGAPIQNKVLLDGITIYNPFHSIGFFSVFETETIRNIDVMTGGFNADHAGRISAVVDIKTKDGNKKNLGGVVSASPFQSKVMLEGPIVPFNEKSGGSTSFMFSGKHSYLDRTSPVLYNYATTNEEGLPFGFTDLYGKVSFLSGNGTKLNLSGFNFADRVKFAETEIAWNTVGGGAQFILIPAATNLIIGGTIAYSDYGITMNEKSIGKRESGINGFNIGLDFTYYGSNTEIKYGLEVNGFETRLNFRNPIGITVDQVSNQTELGAFVKMRQRYGNLVIEPGLRLQYYASLSNLSVEPRLAAKLNVNDNLRFKFAGGVYSQNLISTVNEQDIVNLFVGFLSGPDEFIFKPNSRELANHKLQKAIHGMAGVEIDLSNNLEINIEPYIKRFTQLINLSRFKFEPSDPNFATETGNAYGLDFLIKYNTPKDYLWIAYSLGRVDRNDGFQVFPSNFDRRHNLNILYSRILGSKKQWELSGRWNFGTGFPFTLTQGFYHNINFISDLDIDYTTANNDLFVLYSDRRNDGRLSAFHRLDISAKHTWRFSKSMRLESNFTITNVYNRNNIFYLERLTNNRIFQLPILPSLSLSFFF
jgi:hypothetical protein